MTQLHFKYSFNVFSLSLKLNSYSWSFRAVLEMQARLGRPSCLSALRPPPGSVRAAQAAGRGWSVVPSGTQALLAILFIDFN